MIQNIPSIPARHQRSAETGQAVSGAGCLRRSALGLTLFTIPPCSVDGADWQCYLPWILYILSALAVLLGLVLVLVVVMAIRSYLKKKADLKVGP